jgi:hypothetical protein
LIARRLVLLLGTRFLPKIGLSSVLFSQQPEGGDGRLIFTVSCFSFRGALLCTVACHYRSYHAIRGLLPLRRQGSLCLLTQSAGRLTNTYKGSEK